MNPSTLLAMIGKLTVENESLKAQIAQLTALNNGESKELEKPAPKKAKATD